MDSKTRFSSRVNYYVKSRPGYPPAVIETLTSECGLTDKSVIADIGSGTGLLSKVFLNAGCRVFGVEPNPEMRAAGERLLSEYSTFISIDGSAEKSGLPDSCADFVTAGQAFHWFDPLASRKEFIRILRPGGRVVLVWNGRRLDTTPFLKEYETLLQKYALDYNQVNHLNVETDSTTIPNFFNGEFSTACFDNIQVLDYPGVEGRLLSSSYVPDERHPSFTGMLAELKQIFTRNQVDGLVRIEYDTRMFYGKLQS